MLEIARTQERAGARRESRGYSWGIVDAILGAVMLPFGIWVWLIERMVLLSAAWLGR